MNYCSATMPYYSQDGMFASQHWAVCQLHEGHEGNHLAIVDGKERAFPNDPRRLSRR
jgi:hypothetical protein